MLTTRIFAILFPIFFIILIGYLYARIRPLEIAATNRVNMEIFAPALVLSVLTDRSFDVTNYWQLILACSAIIFISGLIVWPFLRFLSVSGRTFLPPIMFTNTGNMGLPVALFAFGDMGLQAAIVLSIITMGLHLTVGISLVNPHANWRSLFTTPMIIATVVGLALNILHWPLPTILATPISMLGQVTIPLMLFALGVSLTTVSLADWRIGFIGGILCPLTGLFALLAIASLLTLPPVQFAVLTCFAVLPPAVMNYIFAEQYQQEPQKVASIVFLGNLLSLVTLPIALAWALSMAEVSG